jgi:hypothetical protein
MFIHCVFLIYATFKGDAAEFLSVCGKGNFSDTSGCLVTLGVTVGIKAIGCRS